MVSGSQYDEEQEVTRSEMVQLMTGAKETVFTVTFRKKVDVKGVEKALEGMDSSDLEKKDFVELLTKGDLQTITCFKTKSEQSLGRSLVIDVVAPYGKGYRQVDHRTVEELIYKNVKYTLKK